MNSNPYWQNFQFAPNNHLGDNCIQNVHLWRYIIGNIVGKFVLRRHLSGAVERNLRPYNRWYISQNENFEYGYPHSNALFNIYSSKAQHFAPNWSFVNNVKQLRQPITRAVTYDVGDPTVYRRIYWRKFLTSSNQTLRYIRKFIRIWILCLAYSSFSLNIRYFMNFTLKCINWCQAFGGKCVS